MRSATFRDVNIGGSRWVALASVALALVVTACSGGTDETVVPLTDPPTTSTTASPTSAPTTTAAPTTTTPTPIVETTKPTTAAPVAPAALPTTAEVSTLLQGERDALIDALGENGDKTAVALEQFVTTRRLEELQTVVAERAAGGFATRRATIDRIDVLSLSPSGDDGAFAIVCLTSDTVVYEVASGDVVDDTLGYILRSVALVWDGSRWAIDGQRQLAVGTDSAACAA